MKQLHTAPESLFWYWINERHAIYLKRFHGDPKPWTEDWILRDFKFTNVFRQLDRGTVWLRENFLEPHRDCPECDGRGKILDAPGNVLDGRAYWTSCDYCSTHLGLIAFNICWYRMFNWWPTGRDIGWQTSWDSRLITAKLTDEQRMGKQIFTGAHIVYSTPGRPKIDVIVDVCTDLWNRRQDIVLSCVAQSLETTFGILKETRCVGGFMAYEMVSDMRWTKLLDGARDILTWANPGPGAKRGLRRLGLPFSPDQAAIDSMQYLLLASQSLYGPLQPHVPPLEMRDIEHSLCEFDKYCRVKFEEGEPRSKFNGRA